MIRGLLLKSAQGAWVTVALLAGALLVVEALLGYVLPTYFQELSSQFPQIEFIQRIVQALLGAEIGDALSPAAIGAIAWVHPVVLATVWTCAILLATRVPAGEIDRGTIDVLLGMPVRRWSLWAVECAVLATAGVVLLAAGVAGHRLGSLAVGDGAGTPTARLLPVLVNLYALYLVVGGLSAVVSAASDRRGRAVGLVFAVLLASFLLNFLTQLWPVAERLRFASLLHYYQPLAILREDGPVVWPAGDILILAAAAAVLWGIGGAWFARRDIATL